MLTFRLKAEATRTLTFRLKAEATRTEEGADATGTTVQGVRAIRGGPRERRPRPSGPRDARVWRRHRPRSARGPARAARRRLPVGDLRRDRRPPPRASHHRLPRDGG